MTTIKVEYCIQIALVRFATIDEVDRNPEYEKLQFELSLSSLTIDYAERYTKDGFSLQ